MLSTKGRESRSEVLNRTGPVRRREVSTQVARRHIGLDIGSTAIRAAEVSMSGGKARLVRVAQVPTPAGAVARGGGRDLERVSEAIRELWRSRHFRTKDVMIGVGNERVVERGGSLSWLGRTA